MSHERIVSETCKFRYDEKRTGTTKKPNDVTLHRRCTLNKYKNKACAFPYFNHIGCPLSTHKKPRNKNNKTKRRFPKRTKEPRA